MDSDCVTLDEYSEKSALVTFTRDIRMTRETQPGKNLKAEIWMRKPIESKVLIL